MHFIRNQVFDGFETEYLNLSVFCGSINKFKLMSETSRLSFMKIWTVGQLLTYFLLRTFCWTFRLSTNSQMQFEKKRMRINVRETLEIAKRMTYLLHQNSSLISLVIDDGLNI